MSGNVFIVDDQPANLDLLSSILREAGYTVRMANSGRRAVPAVMQQPPEVILLDINMPDLDGYAVCRQLKADPKTASIPVIFLSALDEVRDKVEAFNAGGVDYVTKPFHAAEVVARVETQLQLARLVAELERKNAELEHKNAELEAAWRDADGLFEAYSDALLGMVLDGKYRVDVKIGAGGFAAVYRGLELATARPVAVKILRGVAAGVGRKRVMLEQVGAGRVAHPNAVEVLDGGVTPAGIAYIVMELLEGRTLGDELRAAAPLPLRRCAEVLIPVCQVLAEAHRAGILHRDVKPDNILLHRGPNGEVVKLVDFGLARLQSDAGQMNLTSAGRLLGTPIYMSPERLVGSKYDAQADVYSVGIMLYEALSGALPFDVAGSELGALILKIAHGAPRPLESVRADLPPEVHDLVARAMARAPAARPSAAQLALELWELLDEEGRGPIVRPEIPADERVSPSPYIPATVSVRMSEQPSDFIRDMIRADVAAGKHGGKVVTRFPPEPNGHLHIGHAKAICIDFGVAKEFGGRCHLRMDDTNPTTEDVSYVEAIQRDIKWLGFDWGEHLYYASDYFQRFYNLAERLIERGRAYVCDLPDEEFGAKYRGTITEAGNESPYRKRSVEENLDLLRRMRKGEFKDGEKVLRAKIDMSSPNMKMRDPPLLRIKHAHHYRTGDAWCLYPLYDYAHCLEDSFEGVTHSLCTMEFESARELYDWVIQATEVPHVPKQTEFARLNLTYTVMSKRKLLQLVEQKLVSGWDDPRMPTIAGFRRRGYTPASIRDFIGKVGVAKNISTVDVALLESCVREDLDPRSPRVMCVRKPLELVIESFPENEVEEMDAPYWPPGTSEPADDVAPALRGSRKLPFSRTLYIEHEDFAEVAPAGWKRLAPGREVRLRHGYIVTCTRVEKANDEVVRVFATHDPATRGGIATPGKRVEGTIHWVSAAQAKDVEVRIYDRLFTSENPGDVVEGRDWLEDMNPASLAVMRAKAEPSLAQAKAGDRFQFERIGFFYADPDSTPDAPIFNRTVALKDGWAKATAKSGATPSKTTAPAVPAAKRAAAIAAAAAAAAATVAAPSGGAPPSPEAQALVDAHGLTADEARVLVQEPALRALWDDAIAASGAKAHARAIASVLVNDLLGEMRSKKLDSVPFGGAALVDLALLGHEGTISTKQAKDVLAEMIATGKPARAIALAKGMKQIASADALGPIVDEVLAANADVVARYRAGNLNVFGAIVGMVMKQTKGQGNPKVVADLVKQKLS